MEETKEKTAVLIEKGMTYYGKHVPTGEDWVILGVNQMTGEVCVAGWPATIARLSDIINLYGRSPRTIQEEVYVSKTFGVTFLN